MQFSFHSRLKSSAEKMFTSTDLVVVLLSAVLAFLVMRARTRKSKSTLPLPPSLPSLPLVGSLPFINIFEHLPTFFMKKAQKLGPVFTLKMGNRQCLVLNSKDVIQEALIRKSSAFSGRDSVFAERHVANRNRKGITTMNYNSEFKKYRAMSVNILKDFGFGDKLIMETRIALEVQSIVEFLKSHKTGILDPKDMFSIAISNIIFNICLGTRGDYEKGLGKFPRTILDFTSSASPLIEIAPVLRFVPYFKKKFDCYCRLSAEILIEIDRRIKELEQNEEADCFATIFIAREGQNYDHEQLLFIIRDLCGAGLSTTLSSMLWVCVLLANYPDVQNRLQNEIDKNVPRERLPSMKDEAILVYVAAFMHEVWRFRCPVAFAIPHLTLKDTEVGGYFVPEDTSVMINISGVHMDQAMWGDPESFRPDRFLSSDNHLKDTENVMPFSLGRRACPGEILARQEVFLFVTALLQNFTILPGEGGGRIDDRMTNSLLVDPLPFKVQFVSREK